MADISSPHSSLLMISTSAVLHLLHLYYLIQVFVFPNLFVVLAFLHICLMFLFFLPLTHLPLSVLQLIWLSYSLFTFLYPSMFILLTAFSLSPYSFLSIKLFFSITFYLFNADMWKTEDLLRCCCLRSLI